MTFTARIPRPVLLVGRIAIIVAIAGFVAWNVVTNWGQVSKTWQSLAWQSVALSLVAAVAAMGANVLAWRAALADVECEVDVPTAAQICLVGGLAKYLPGSVWSYVLQMELGRRAGLPRPRAFLASLIATGLGLVTALLVGLAGLPTLLREASTGSADQAGAVRTTLWVMLILLPIALLCAVPAVLTRLVQVFLRLVRRPGLENPLTWAGVLRVVGFSALGWALFGVHLWLLANERAAPGIGGLLVCVGAFAIAMSVGMFVVISPSGLGVRESVLVAAMVPFLAGSDPKGTAIGIALASRLILTVADLIAAGLAALTGMRALRGSGVAEDSAAS